MAYFKHNQQETQTYTPVFRNSAPEGTDGADLSYDDGFDDYNDPINLEETREIDPEEAAARRKERFRLFNGVFDFVAVILGAVVILMLLAFLFSLYNWVSTDITQTFSLWQNKL